MIPCRNEARSIRALLDALAGQTCQPTEIVIVDDQSTDSSAAIVGQWQREHASVALRLVPGPGLGPGPAMNTGIAAMPADVVVRLDGHCLPDPDYIEQSVRALADVTVGVAGGVWRVRAGGETAVARAIALVVSHPLGSGGARYRHPDGPGPESMAVETVPFGAFPRTLWEQLGGFDESLSANEDFDFNYRARLAGFRVVLDRRIKATYVARSELHALWRQYFGYGFWKFRMLRKDVRAIHWRQALPMLVLPWMVATVVALVLWPSLGTSVAAGLYPAVLLLGALHLAVRGAGAAWALAALATVHLGWSAGFWRGALGGSPPIRRAPDPL
ncbi:MAG TPA: glycosyltransferase family 2 protein [Vicinamibacterales bacterium]|nr:glycosyltransferase family 2 protein [Vicinamibacterales bacterium]